MSSPGMHHHARRLVQHRNNFILKQDFERHLLGACRFARSDLRFAPDYLVIGAPLTRTPPERITAWILERETAGKQSASQRSSRSPALGEETLKIRDPDSEVGEFLCEKIISTG
jgi:hypothetical protein